MTRNRPNTDSGNALKNPRNDWREIGGRDASPITARCKQAPGRMIPEANGESFVGISEGKLWRIFPDQREPVQLAASVSLPLAAIQFPTPSEVQHQAGRGFQRLVVSARDKDKTVWYQLDLGTDTFEALSIPGTTPFEYEPNSEIMSSRTFSDQGDRLFLSNLRLKTNQQLLAINDFKKEFKLAETRLIDYKSQDGKALLAGLILPVNYDPKKRYPLIVYVYPGDTISRKPDSNLGNYFLNLQFLAAHGYAVLQPSMPLPPSAEVAEVYAALTNGVDPAIDKAIEIGIADPNRIGIMGHSFGGYGTVGLISQSKRFKAAVAMAGSYDLFSWYGTFSQRYRYGPEPQVDMYHVAWAESGQGRLGSPPWSDPERYLRNSPIFHVEQIETPVLLIAGDQDTVPMEQSEEMFTALYRLNKRAKFIRYWGENHAIVAPANMRHLWQQIFAWFDEFLMKPEK